MCKQSNQDIRNILDQYNIRHSQLAVYVGVNKWTFSHWMSKPLTKDKLSRVYNGINKLVNDRESQLDELSTKIKKTQVLTYQN